MNTNWIDLGIFLFWIINTSTWVWEWTLYILMDIVYGVWMVGDILSMQCKCTAITNVEWILCLRLVLLSSHWKHNFVCVKCTMFPNRLHKWYIKLAHTSSLVSIGLKFVKLVERVTLGSAQRKFGSTHLPLCQLCPTSACRPRTSTSFLYLRSFP